MGYFIRYIYFPLSLLAVLGGASFLLKNGWEIVYVMVVSFPAAIFFVAVGERLFPFDPDWNRSRGDVRTDLLHSLITSYLCREIFKFGLLFLFVPLAVWLAGQYGSSIWPEHWPLALRVLLIAVIAEFGNYWAHRLAHEKEILWRLHSVHHSPLRLYWLNAGRDHPLGVVWVYALETVPLILLGCDAEALTLFFILEAMHGLYQHGNVDVKLGWLNWIFSGPDLHRWHHSTIPAEANRNYGATLICWDLLFGTRFLPGDRRVPAEIGLGTMPNFPGGFWQQWEVPFYWEKLKAGSWPPGEIEPEE